MSVSVDQYVVNILTETDHSRNVHLEKVDQHLDFQARPVMENRATYCRRVEVRNRPRGTIQSNVVDRY